MAFEAIPNEPDVLESLGMPANYISEHAGNIAPILGRLMFAPDFTIADALAEVSKKVDSPEKLAFACYSLGKVMAEMNHIRKTAERVYGGAPARGRSDGSPIEAFLESILSD